MPTFTKAITNTLKVGFLVGILSALLGLLFAYVEVYVRVGKFVGGLSRSFRCCRSSPRRSCCRFP